jgi:hypothetical protein
MKSKDRTEILEDCKRGLLPEEIYAKYNAWPNLEERAQILAYWSIVKRQLALTGAINNKEATATQAAVIDKIIKELNYE